MKFKPSKTLIILSAMFILLSIAFSLMSDVLWGMAMALLFVLFADIVAVIIRLIKKGKVKPLLISLPIIFVVFCVFAGTSPYPKQVAAYNATTTTTTISTTTTTTATTLTTTTTEATTETTTATTTTVVTTTEATTQATTLAPTTKVETTTQATTTTAKPTTTTVKHTEPTTAAPVSKATTTTQAQAPVVTDNDRTVYIGKTGNKYHSSNCRTLKNSGTAISLATAKAQGRTACQICGG